MQIMKNVILWVVLIIFFSVLLSCRDNAKDYKDELREGVWYVADIDSDYKFYTGMTPGLLRYVRYLMDEKNLLFWPGDQLIFSGKRLKVMSPGGVSYGYDYFFEGGYVQIGNYGVYYGLKPDGDNERMVLEFDKTSLRKLLNEQGEYELLEETDNLKRFHITYELQRPVPPFAQMMSGIYAGELYDGTNQLIYENAFLNFFWDGMSLNLSMDEQIILENGSRIYIEIPDLQVWEGFTPDSYEFAASRILNDPVSGKIEIQVEGRYNAARTVTMNVYIYQGEQVYQLQFLRGVRQWDLEVAAVKSASPGIILKASSK